MKNLIIGILLALILLISVRCSYCNTLQYQTIKGVMTAINNNLQKGQYEIDAYECCRIIFKQDHAECTDILKDVK